MPDVEIERGPIHQAKLVQVIETKSVTGRGIPADPIRILSQYWDFDGRLLATNDPSTCATSSPGGAQ